MNLLYHHKTPDLSYFFFSSRRRHTRSTRDWSSDVCSSDLGLIREHLDLPAQLRDVLPQRFDQLGEIDDPVLPGGIQLPEPRVDRGKTLLDRLLARLDLVFQLEDLLARLVVVEKRRVGRARQERGP